MSGGGSHITRGKMRLGSAAPVVADPTKSRAELVAAEERLQQLEAELEEHRHAAAENARRADAAVKAQESAAMDFQKSRLAVESGTRKVKELQRLLQELDASLTVCLHGSPCVDLPGRITVLLDWEPIAARWWCP